MMREMTMGGHAPATSDSQVDPEASQRLFRFGRAQFNEASQELLVDGERRKLTAKPRAVLQALLRQPNTVVSSDKLEAVAWPGKQFRAPNSLDTAIYTLRAALGGDLRALVKTVPGVGYMLACPVEATPIEPLPHPPLSLNVGDPVPFRPDWRLQRRLDDATDTDIWLARNSEPYEQRVFKFAGAFERLADLEREAASSHALQAKLGERDDIVPVVDDNFENHPFFIATPCGGIDLPAWLAMGHGESEQPDRAARIALIARISHTLGDAHDAGEAHGALGPGNVLVAIGPDGATEPRLAAFGGQSRGFLYQPPESLLDGTPTLAGDVYALGILLYQVLIGDFTRPLAAGWERAIGDDLLCQDIAVAAAGDRALRLDSAKTLATRLETLESRRAMARAELERAAESERLTQTAELRRVEAAHAAEQARRARVTATVLGVLLLVASALAVWALREQHVAVAQRNRADQIAGIAEDTVSGIIDDMARGVSARSILTLSDLRELEERARATVSRLSRFTPDAPGLRRLEARDLDRLADTDLHQGDLTGGLVAARRAASLQYALLKNNPLDSGLWTDLAESDRWIGDIALKRRDLPAASTAYDADRDSLEHAAALDKHNPSIPVELARAYEAMGDVKMLRNDFAGALLTYEYALNLIKGDLNRAAGNGSGGLLDLSVAQEKIGDALSGEKDWRGSLAAYQSDLSIRQRLAALDPDNMRRQRDVAVALLDVGDDQQALNDLTAAAASYNRAHELDEERAAKDPSNTLWQEDLVIDLSDIGEVDAKAGDLRGAATAYKKAVSILEALTKKDPTDAGFAFDLATVETALAADLARLGDVRGAAPHAVRALAYARHLATGRPNDAGVKELLDKATALAARLKVG